MNNVKYFAESPEDVRLLAEKDGYLLLEIGEVYTITPVSRKKLSIREFLTFNQELSVLTKAGQPVVKALEIILEKAPVKKGFFKVLEVIKTDVEQGLSLSEAMEKHPDYFPMLYIANLKAGEKGGNLTERLKDYQVYMKKVEELRRKMVTSSVYPIMILGVIFLAVVFLFTYVVPNFSKIYLDANVELPLATRALLVFTKAFQVVMPLAAAFLVVMFFAFKKYTRTHKGRLFVDAMKFKLPFVSGIYSNYLISNFARTLSAILKGGMPLVGGLKTSSSVSTNSYFSDKLKQATRMVEEGNSLSASLDKTGVFPPISLRLIKAGEGTGALWEMLDEVAEYYDSIVVDSLTMATTLIEPALMIIMGVLVGTIVVAMYLPIFSLAGAISG